MKSVLACLVLITLHQKPAVAQTAAGLDQTIMIIIATASSGTGVTMMRLSFPSEDACKAAAKILQEDIRGGFVTARCLRTH